MAAVLLFGHLGLEAGEVPAIVFVSRELKTEPGPDTRLNAIERSAVGRLLVREADGVSRVLVDAAAQTAGPGMPTDVMDPDVSFDGRRIVFAGYSEEERAWRIYEVDASGTGLLRKLTHSDRQVDLTRYGRAAELFRSYDDVDPCYLPDGRICFVSTRYPGVAPDGRLRATNLYVVNADGSDLHRITAERFGADTPTIEPETGKIVYSRWWRTAQLQADPGSEPPDPIPPGSPGYGDIVVEESEVALRGIEENQFPGVNSWFLSRVDPDGTDLAMFSGFRLDRGLTQAYRPSFLPGGEALALFIPETPFIGYPRGYGLRRFQAGPGAPEALGGPQAFEGSNVDPAGAGVGVPVARPAFFYASASALPDGRLLVTAAPWSSRVPDYGIYIQKNSQELPVLLHNLLGTAELDAVPLAARNVPPVIPDKAVDRMVDEAPQTVDEALARGGAFTFLVENIHFNAPVDVPIPHAPPIGKRLAIEFYMGPQMSGMSADDPPILIRRLDIPPDGKIKVDLPAGVPLFEVLKRSDGSIPLGRDGQIFHVGGMNFGRAGETNRCVGCHAGHSQIQVPPDPSWTNVAPSATVRASSSRSRRSPEEVLPPPPAPESFTVGNLVDRRTAGIDSQWAALEKPSSTVELLWSAKIRAREVVLYGLRASAGQFGPTDQVIHALKVETSLDRVARQTIAVAEDILPEGTSVPLNPELELNSLLITISSRDVTGLLEGQKGPGLAEVEVIAQVAGPPTTSFIRGDADCGGAIDLTDAIFILGHLFLGGRRPCCQAGADANDDARLDLTDAIYLLSFMFLGSQPPLPPFPRCGPSHDSALTCEQDTCF